MFLYIRFVGLFSQIRKKRKIPDEQPGYEFVARKDRDSHGYHIRVRDKFPKRRVNPVGSCPVLPIKNYCFKKMRL